MTKKIRFVISVTALSLALFYYGSASKSAQSAAAVTSTPVPILCDRVAGLPMPWQGSGACAGNTHIQVSLSELYPGLALHYNSTGTFDPIGFGKNWTLSEVTFVNTASNSMMYGNGFTLPLEKKTSGKWNGRWLAKRRDILNDYFSQFTDLSTLWQQSMHGTSNLYKIQPGTSVYRLAEVTNRFGEKTKVHVGVDLTGEKITYSDGKVVGVSRSASSIELSQGNRRVTLTLDSSKRVTRIESSKGVIHSLTYEGTTPRVLRHTWSQLGKEYIHSYSYDVNGKLLSFKNEKGLSTSFARNFTDRTVKTQSWNGQVHVETFDVNKRIVSEVLYMVRKQDSPLSKISYEYNSNGTLKKVILPQQTTEYIYSADDPMLLVWEKVYENDALIRVVGFTSDKDTWVTSRTTVTRGDGSVITDVQTKFSTALPFIPTETKDLVLGNRQTFNYGGNQTTVAYYNKNGTKIQTDVLDRRNLKSRTNHLAPAGSNVTNWTYTTSDQVKDFTLGGRKTSFGYDDEGRQSYAKFIDGREVTTIFDEHHYVTEETTKYPTGILEKLMYDRVFHPDKSIETLVVTRSLPNGVTETSEFQYSTLVEGHKLILSKLNDVTHD